jgi:hypothetical protein
MKFLKWMLIIAGSLVVLLVVAGVGGYFYVVSGPSLELSARDLDVGSPWSATEREAFVATCMRTSPAEHRERAPVFCECVTKELETQASRVERLIFAAGLEDNWRQMAKVVLATGILTLRTDKSLDEHDIGERVKRTCGKLHG